MLAVPSAEAQVPGPTLPLTPSPSPSPPSLRRRTPPPLILSSSNQRSSSSSSSSTPAADLLRAEHVAHARRIAEQVRLLHIAKAVYSSSSSQPSTSSPTSSSLPSTTERRAAEASLRFTRYQVEVERSEGGKTVMKKITVIIPGGGREKGAPYPASAESASTSSRRLSLPSLRTLSLLPPTQPNRLYKPARHTLPPSPSSTSSRSNTSTSSTSSASTTDSTAAFLSQLQRRRPALTLRQQQRESKLLTKYRVSRARERMASLTEEREEGEEAESLSLAERRGRVVPPLVLV